MLNNYDDIDDIDDELAPMNHQQVIRNLKHDYQMFDVERREFIDYDILQEMLDDSRYAGRTSTNRIKKRIL